MQWLWKLYRWYNGLKKLASYVMSFLFALILLLPVVLAWPINKLAVTLAMLFSTTFLVSMIYYTTKVKHKKALDGRETNDFLVRWGVTLFSVAVAGVPTWLYLFARASLQPEGFWQNLVLTGLGLFFGGLFQLMLLGALVAWLFIVWGD